MEVKIQILNSSNQSNHIVICTYLTIFSLGNGSASQNLHGTSSRLSRVHNQLVSQMRATFRAMEMSPDLAQRGKSPLANAKVKVSQAVMEKTQKNAVKITVNKTNSNTKQELRALSQRLERMLRERREANNPDSLEAPRLVDLDDFFLSISYFLQIVLLVIDFMPTVEQCFILACISLEKR